MQRYGMSGTTARSAPITTGMAPDKRPSTELRTLGEGLKTGAQTAIAGSRFALFTYFRSAEPNTPRQLSSPIANRVSKCGRIALAAESWVETTSPYPTASRSTGTGISSRTYGRATLKDARTSYVLSAAAVTMVAKSINGFITASYGDRNGETGIGMVPSVSRPPSATRLPTSSQPLRSTLRSKMPHPSSSQLPKECHSQRSPTYSTSRPTRMKRTSR